MLNDDDPFGLGAPTGRRDTSIAALERRVADRARDRQEQAGVVISRHLADVRQGVTASWLAEAFEMDPATVKKRLTDCPPLHRRKAGYVYNLRQAAPYLVKPVFDIHKYLKDMKPSELPPQLTKEYWQAALNRQKYEENAGELFRAAHVVSLFAGVFKMLKETMQLWTEELEQSTGLTEEQRQELIRLVDSLQETIHAEIVKIAGDRKTLPIKAEIPVEVELKPENGDNELF